VAAGRYWRTGHGIVAIAIGQSIGSRARSRASLPPRRRRIHQSQPRRRMPKSSMQAEMAALAHGSNYERSEVVFGMHVQPLHAETKRAARWPEHPSVRHGDVQILPACNALIARRAVVGPGLRPAPSGQPCTSGQSRLNPCEHLHIGEARRLPRHVPPMHHLGPLVWPVRPSQGRTARRP
jgi:hypothetical protein